MSALFEMFNFLESGKFKFFNRYVSFMQRSGKFVGLKLEI